MSVTVINKSVSSLAQAFAQKKTALPAVVTPRIALPTPALAKPMTAVIKPVDSFTSATAFLAQRTPLETTFATNSTSPTITLTKAYSSNLEVAGDTGLKPLATTGTLTNTVSETVSLRKGVIYTLNTSFGLNNIKGNALIAVKDANGTTLSSIKSAVGKTSAALTFTPAADGVFAISLTGQPIAPTKTTAASTTDLYSSYRIQVTQPLSKLPTKSGNTNVDALVLGGTNAWQHAVGSTATTSTNVINDSLKSLNNVVDNSAEISYAFMDDAFLGGLTGNDAKKPSVMDDVTKTAVTSAFDYLSTLINVKFKLANSATDASIIFGENAQKTTSSAGYANPPNQSGTHPQYLFLANDASTNDSATNGGFATGTYGWQTLVHEIAHTMGLKHPFNGNAGGGGSPAPYLPPATNNHRYSVMSYTSAADSKILTATVKNGSTSVSQAQVSPSTYMTYDIAALQYLYGANTDTTSTDAKLTKIQTLDFTDNYKGMQTLWTPNGATLDASATTHKNIIDLRGGAYSSINYLGTGAAQFTNQINAAGITESKAVASQVKYFNASITAAYTANNNVALAYGSKITQAKGGAADDAFYVSNYASSLVGGAGTDTVYLTGAATDWTASNNTSLLSKGGALSSDIVLTNKTTKAQISLNGIEKYAFYNATSLITKT